MRINNTVAHIVNECQGLTQKESKRWRHDQVAKIIGSCVRSRIFSVKKTVQPENVLESETLKIVSDISIQTYKKLEDNKSEILVEDKIEKEGLIIDRRREKTED